MTTIESLTLLFGAYGRANDAQQIAIYRLMLADLPPQLLTLAVKKCIRECKFLPSVAEIISQCESLNNEIHEEYRVKEWGEAWGEIEKAMQSTPWDKTPTFSTPEITAAVNNFGWHDLQASLAEDMPTVRAQMRRFYEDACGRASSKARAEYALGRNTTGLLGVSSERQGLTAIGTACRG